MNQNILSREMGIKSVEDMERYRRPFLDARRVSTTTQQTTNDTSETTVPNRVTASPSVTANPTSTSTRQLAPQSAPSKKLPIIIGSVIGGVLFLLLIGVIAAIVKRKRRQDDDDDDLGTTRP